MHTIYLSNEIDFGVKIKKRITQWMKTNLNEDWYSLLFRDWLSAKQYQAYPKSIFLLDKICLNLLLPFP
jgi:hypothetical protein